MGRPPYVFMSIYMSPEGPHEEGGQNSKCIYVHNVPSMGLAGYSRPSGLFTSPLGPHGFGVTPETPKGQALGNMVLGRGALMGKWGCVEGIGGGSAGHCFISWIWFFQVHGQGGVRFQNWAKTYGSCPELYFQPTSVEEVREVRGRHREKAGREKLRPYRVPRWVITILGWSRGLRQEGSGLWEGNFSTPAGEF